MITNIDVFCSMMKFEIFDDDFCFFVIYKKNNWNVKKKVDFNKKTM